MMNVIRNNDDINAFLSFNAGFHDSCIVSVNYVSGNYVGSDGGMYCAAEDEHILKIVFHSQWCKNFELVFTGVRKFSVVGWRKDYFCDILDSFLSFVRNEDGEELILWADNEYFSPDIQDKPFSQNDTYVIAKGLMWRIIE